MPRVAVQNLPYSLRFNGGTYVPLTLASGLPLYNTTAYSVAFWFKAYDYSLADQDLWGEGNTGTNTPLFNIHIAHSGARKVGVFLRNNAGTMLINNVDSELPIRDGWNHVAWADVAGSCSLYINGVKSSTNFNYTPAGTFTLDTSTIGAVSRTAIGNYIKGWMSGVQLFNYGLNSTQVLAVMNGALKGNVGSYSLTEGTGTAANDASGNGNHGTIANGSWSTDTPTKLRTVSANRVTAQNMNCALSLRTATSIVDCGADPIGTGDVTVIGWFKALTFGGYSQGRIIGNQKFILRVTPLNSLYAYNDGAASVSSGNNTISLNSWYHVGITRKASGAISFYINGVLTGTPDQIPSVPSASTTNLFLGNSVALLHNFDGLLKNWVTVNRICSQAEIQAHRNGITPSDATRIYKMNEGTGSTIYDSSGSGVNGSITNGTFVSDTPTKKRQLVGGNLIHNGDFSHIPEVNEPQTANNKFMDGTTTGSSTNNLFGWSIGSSAGSFSALFDRSNRTPLGNPSLKLSLLDVGSTVSALLPGANGLLTGFFGKSVLSVLPSTSYTLNFYIKTNYISGDSDEGAFISIAGSTGAGTSSGFFANSAKYTTTTDWVKQTLVFTTTATTRYLQVYPRNSGAVGSATLIMDAWFGNITLTKTTPDTRTAVS